MSHSASSRLREELKGLPLIEHADFRQPNVAYDAFMPLMEAILQAALVQVPASERRGANRRLFKRFVVRFFPDERGRDDDSYAEALWRFRCSFVKNKQTGNVSLTQGASARHKQSFKGRLTLNLESLIGDFRHAVDAMVTELEGSDPSRVSEELTRRTVHLFPSGAETASFTTSQTIVSSAKAASGTA